jgi:hypothetical protein
LTVLLIRDGESVKLKYPLILLPEVQKKGIYKISACIRMKGEKLRKKGLKPHREIEWQ